MGTTWQIEKTIDIRQPPEVVFDYLCRFENVQEWDGSVLSACRLSSGKPAVGSRFRVTLLFGWRRVPMAYEIVSMEPPHRLALKGSAEGFDALDRIRFERTAAGTRLTYAAEVVFTRFLPGILDRVSEGLFQRNAEQAVRLLQTLLSGSAAAPALMPLTRLADQAVVPGLIGFTRLGYLLGKQRAPVASALYAGKTMVLTGGTSGIGRAAARALAARGARLVVVGRDPAKLERLSAALRAIGGGGEIHTETADLSLTADVRRLAARLNRRCGRVEVLLNNAGALFNRHQVTAEGIEKTLATDLLGPYLLTRLLLPSLKAAAGARILNMASGGMYTQGIRVDDLQFERTPYDGPTAYARAKRGLVVLTGIWARELAPHGIRVHAMHPGWVDTPGLEKALPAFHRWLRPWLRTAAQGADTLVWLAAAPDAGRVSGRFWLDRKPHPAHVFPGTRESARDRVALVKALDELGGLEP